MKFIHVEDALEEVLSDFGTLVTHLPKDTKKYLPIIHLSPSPSAGEVETFLSEDRFVVSVMAEGRTNTRDLTYSIAEYLDGNYFETSHGLLDRVEVIIRPNETPLEDDTLNSFNFSILVKSRAIN